MFKKIEKYQCSDGTLVDSLEEVKQKEKQIALLNIANLLRDDKGELPRSILMSCAGKVMKDFVKMYTVLKEYEKIKHSVDIAIVEQAQEQRELQELKEKKNQAPLLSQPEQISQEVALPSRVEKNEVTNAAGEKVNPTETTKLMLPDSKDMKEFNELSKPNHNIQEAQPKQPITPVNQAAAAKPVLEASNQATPAAVDNSKPKMSLDFEL